MSDHPEKIVTGAEEQDVLFEVAPDWAEAWKGMPGYNHEDLMPWQTVLVHFKHPDDRTAFAKLVGQHLHERTKFIWYPKAEIGTAADKVYTATKVTPRYPIYIISKGRWESRLTVKAMEFTKIPYKIVVEPQEFDQYAKVIDPKNILTLPFSNLGLGGIPARNWVWEHALTTGADRHWILDDNISGFCRFQENLKVEIDSGVTFCAVEDFTDRYENVVMSGFNYDYFAPRKQGSRIRPFTLNTRIYSGILIKNDLKEADGSPMRWRGRYNEDTDLSLRALKAGNCTVLFNAFLMYKKPTLTMKGGNTDQLYAGVEAAAEAWKSHVTECRTCEMCFDGYDSTLTPCDEGREILSKDGRWLMAESLREQHPDVTTVERKWGRWQHQVNYGPWKNNQLRLRPDAIIPEGDAYAMELVPMPGDVEPEGPEQGRPNGSRDGSGQSSPAGGKKPQGQAATAANPAHSGPSLASFFARQAELQSQPKPEPEAPVAVPSVHEETPVAVVDLPRSEDAQDGDVPVVASESSILSPAPESEPEWAPRTEVQGGMAEFLASTMEGPIADWKPDEIPNVSGVDQLVVNFATSGLNWQGNAEPVGVTISSLDGQLVRFLPFGFKGGGNLPRENVIQFLKDLKNVNIVGANTRFDVHMGRKIGVDFEAQGCTATDVQHYAALLDDHRKQFRLDVLIKDFIGEVEIGRVDESMHADYHAADVAERERYTARMTAALRNKMWPLLDAEELQEVRQLEDDCIYPVVEMEKNGARLDMELLEEYSTRCVQMHDKVMMDISREVGFAFNHDASGWKKLFERLGLPPSDSYAENVIGPIDHPTVQLGHFAAQLASLNSKTFAAYKKNVTSDGILYFDINQLRGDEGGTVTGRFSIGYVQQVPNHDNHAAVFGEDLYPRRLFIAAEGDDCLEADAMQIEYRLFASDAGNPRILQAYKDDPLLSFHKMTWEMIKAYKPDMLYSHQKSFNFARQYGARSIKLAVMMGFITEQEGDDIRHMKDWNSPKLKTIKEIEAAYGRMMPEGEYLLALAAHLAMPECDEYCNKNQMSRKLHKTHKHRGYIKTISGRRGRFESNYKTYIALNKRLQGSGADVMKKKLAELHRARKDTGLLLRMTIHDAVVGDAQTPETLQKVRDILNTQSYPQVKVPILWDANTGKNWAECKK